ncbi:MULTISPECIES: CAAD domain-containing protein [unclassified Prochlorococcus]|uniref:CAAD domain-containing protein n=1 Tax=unclassified Prochlorococcus TaxID=2627481 RepID=UPI0005338AE5|nr:MULTISPECIES: CAAD domain-containing protein [unclassified Prochlorococcus]KGG14666.1 putative membrane protein [Prochlorococcus sp. MIT 0602]KGG15904.1 putative membrane protein [Prochlorococcus sp. MIT 0603]
MSESPESNQDSNATEAAPSGPTISDRANDFMGQANEVLGKVDWSQMGKYGKAAGIIAVVIIAQILIKVVVDTVNFFPLLPGLLELLGIVVVGQWSWQNLTTSEKRNAVLEKVQNIRKEYLD